MNYDPVDTCDCVIWQGPKWSQGRYGRDRINRRWMTAHRAAWIRNHGEIPDGFVVCHKCDNGLCVNIDHLFLGTRSDNSQDCCNKNRNPGCFKNQSGQQNANAQPNLEQRYAAIKADRKSGMSLRAICRKHGLKSNGHLMKILRSPYGND